MGKNVLYITMEMSRRIAERIDANTLNIPMKELPDLSKKMYDKKIEKLKNKTKGKLIVKEYPTAKACWTFQTFITRTGYQERFSTRYYLH